MKKRLITSAVAIAFAVIVLYFSHLIVLEIAVALLAAIAVFEVFRTAGLSKHPVLLCSAWLCAALAVFSARGAVSVPLVYPVVIFIGSVILTAVNRFGKINPESLMTAALFSMYVTAGMYCIVYIRGMKHGLFLTVLSVCTAWLTDSGAYFVGSAFGRHKMAPELSPKKTVEGAVGGVLTTLILGLVATYIYMHFVAETDINYLVLAITLVAAAIVSMFGDLFASSFKRWYNVKDYGKILPGHGGIVDRFDSVFAVMPLFAVALEQFAFFC